MTGFLNSTSLELGLFFHDFRGTPSPWDFSSHSSVFRFSKFVSGRGLKLPNSILSEKHRRTSIVTRGPTQPTNTTYKHNPTHEESTKNIDFSKQVLFSIILHFAAICLFGWVALGHCDIYLSVSTHFFTCFFIPTEKMEIANNLV